MFSESGQMYSTIIGIVQDRQVKTHSQGNLKNYQE
jgi:hypothetical protein